MEAHAAPPCRRLGLGLVAAALVGFAPDLSGGHAPLCACLAVSCGSLPHLPLLTSMHFGRSCANLHRSIRALDDVSPLPAPRLPPPGFLGALTAFMCVHAVVSQAMFVAQMAFFARVADPAIGGTAMTLFNTVANLGAGNRLGGKALSGSRPAVLVLHKHSGCSLQSRVESSIQAALMRPPRLEHGSLLTVSGFACMRANLLSRAPPLQGGSGQARLCSS